MQIPRMHMKMAPKIDMPAQNVHPALSTEPRVNDVVPTSCHLRSDESYLRGCTWCRLRVLINADRKSPSQAITPRPHLNPGIQTVLMQLHEYNLLQSCLGAKNVLGKMIIG